jgi:hypothetical protein
VLLKLLALAKYAGSFHHHITPSAAQGISAGLRWTHQLDPAWRRPCLVLQLEALPNGPITVSVQQVAQGLVVEQVVDRHHVDAFLLLQDGRPSGRYGQKPLIPIFISCLLPCIQLPVNSHHIQQARRVAEILVPAQGLDRALPALSVPLVSNNRDRGCRSHQRTDGIFLPPDDSRQFGARMPG